MLKKLCQMIPVIAISVCFFWGVCLHAFAEENSGTLTDSADSYIDAVIQKHMRALCLRIFHSSFGSGIICPVIRSCISQPCLHITHAYLQVTAFCAVTPEEKL